MSLMSSDAQIAREWAAGFIKYAGNAQIVDADELTAARYILATTTPPTMADIAWDDEVHAGLCAEHEEHGLVRMLYKSENFIECRLKRGDTPWLSPDDLTPIPGTRLDLTPRREPESDGGSDKSPSTNGGTADLPRPEDVPAGEPWIVEYGGHKWVGTREEGGWTDYEWSLARLDGVDYDPASDNKVTLIARLVPESAPDHPEFLETEEDYRSAPEGTIVAQDEGKPFVLIYELWRNPNPWKGDHGDMAGIRRRVLRWGWEA